MTLCQPDDLAHDSLLAQVSEGERYFAAISLRNDVAAPGRELRKLHALELQPRISHAFGWLAGRVGTGFRDGTAPSPQPCTFPQSNISTGLLKLLHRQVVA